MEHAAFHKAGKDTVTLCGAASYTPEGKEEVSPAAGDIVLFRYHGRFIMHRILEVRPDGIYRIQGDGVPKTRKHAVIRIYAERSSP